MDGVGGACVQHPIAIDIDGRAGRRARHCDGHVRVYTYVAYSHRAHTPVGPKIRTTGRQQVLCSIQRIQYTVDH